MFLRIHNAYVILSDPYDRQLLSQVLGFVAKLRVKLPNGRAPMCTYCGHVGEVGILYTTIKIYIHSTMYIHSFLILCIKILKEYKKHRGYKFHICT